MHPLVEWIISNSVAALGLAILALLSSRTFRSPALTHVLWLLVLIKLITPPIFQFPVEVSGEMKVSPQAIVASVVDENILAVLPLKQYQETRIKHLVSTEQVLVFMWLVGSMTWLLLAGYRSWRFNRRLKDAQLMGKEGRLSAASIAETLRLKTLPEIVLVEGRVPPILWSYIGRTTIAIPGDLWSTLTVEEQDTMLAHELAHFKRRDHWYRWIEWTLLTVLWWHPLVWLARLGLRKAEEDSCDAWVLWALPRSAKDYASALLKTLDFLSTQSVSMPVAACGFAERRSFKNVKERFTTILKRQPSHAMNKTQKTFTIALAVLVLPLSGYLLQSQVTAKEGEGPTEAEIVARKKEEKQQSEIQAMQVSVEQRLEHLEKMVEKLVDNTETENKPRIERIVHQQNQVDQQKLHLEHSAHQLELARREAIIEETRLEAEISRKQIQLEHAKQQYDGGRINEQDLQLLQHEAQMGELEAEQQMIKAEAHMKTLEMQVKHQELILKQLERTQEKF